MIRWTCNREQDVVRDLRAGRLSDPVRAHVAGCAACQETSVVSEALLADAARLARESSLPDPTNVWIKAQILARWHAAERATRPIAAVEWAAGACAVTLCIIALAWGTTQIGQWFDVATVMAALAQRPSAGPVSALGSIVTASSLLFIVPMLVGIYLAWAEQ